jgi:DNA-directed RNA polymerase specialized sigma24 family protein
MQELNRMPTLNELSKATQLSVKQVENALNVIAAFPISLEATDEHLTIEDSSQLEAAYQSELITDAIEKLNPEQQEVIIRSFLNEQTPAEIASALGNPKPPSMLRGGAR